MGTQVDLWGRKLQLEIDFRALDDFKTLRTKENL